MSIFPSHGVSMARANLRSVKYPTDPAARRVNKRIGRFPRSGERSRHKGTQREFSRGLDRKNSFKFAEFSLRNILPSGVHRGIFPLTFTCASINATRQGERFSSKVIVLHCKRRLATRHFLTVSRRARSLGALHSARICIFFPPPMERHLSRALEISIGDSKEIRSLWYRVLLCVRSTVADAIPRRAMLGLNSHLALDVTARSLISNSAQSNK